MIISALELTSLILPRGAWVAKIVHVQVLVLEKISYLVLMPYMYFQTFLYTQPKHTSHSTILRMIAIACVPLIKTQNI